MIYWSTFEKFDSLVSLVSHFKDNKTCKEFLVKQCWTDGETHTNTIEGFWSQLKRSIFGIYHFVSAKHLQRYVDESVFRYNTCKQKSSDRFKLMFLSSIVVVRYQDVLNIA